MVAENTTVRPAVTAVPDRRDRLVSLGEFLPESGHHEQAVVDRQPQSDQGHNRGDERVDLGEVGDEADDTVRRDDREATGDEGQRGSDDTTEHEEQQDADGGDRRGSPCV